MYSFSFLVSSCPTPHSTNERTNWIFSPPFRTSLPKGEGKSTVNWVKYFFRKKFQIRCKCVFEESGSMEVDLPPADCGQRDPASLPDVAAKVNGAGTAMQQLTLGDIPVLILHRMCNFAKERELKLYRLVSRAWNHVVTSHPKFYQMPVKLGRGWGMKAEALDQCSLTKWTNIKFRYFNYNKQPYIRIFWPQIEDGIRTLQLEHLTIKCHDLANLINSCNQLESLVLRAVSVTPVYQPDLPERGNNPPDQRPAENQEAEAGPKAFIFCEHSQGNDAKRFQPTQPFRAPTITSLEIYEQDTLPICVLQVIRERCLGVLVNFNFEDCPRRQQLVFSPDTNTMVGELGHILEDSQDVLKSFSFLNNATGENLLHALAAPGRFNRGFSLKEFAVHIEPTAPRRDGEPRRVPAVGTQILAILQRMQDKDELNSVAIAMIMDQGFFTLLEPILQGTASLRKLAISFYVRDDNAHVPVHLLLPQLLQVQELTVEDAELLKAPYVAHWQFQRHLDNAYVNHLPPALTSLTLYHFWLAHQDANPDPMNVLLQSPRIRNLTKFELRESELFRDDSLQLIIRNMRQLEELNIIKCVGLTDSGVTGLNADTCSALASCNGQTLMSTGTLLAQNRWCLAQLTNMRRLSFHGCVKLTDVSIRYGIFFDKLQSLNLTECANISDIGLSWLAQGNPSLEVLTVRHVHRVSRHGLNLFISQHKNINKIYASETCAKRSTEPHMYLEHPLFGDIVDATRIRKSPEEHKLDRRYRNPHRRWRRRWR